MSQESNIFCPLCQSLSKEIKTFVRELKGCHANCSGKMIEKTAYYKCKKYGKLLGFKTNTQNPEFTS